MVGMDSKEFYITQASPTIGGNSPPAASGNSSSSSSTSQGADPSSGAQGTEDQPAPSDGYLQLLFPVLLIGVLYFLLIRPQQKKEKERQKLLKGLRKGDKVVTRGGLWGVITHLQDDKGVCQVKIADKVNVEVSTNAIEVVNPDTKKKPTK